MKKSELTPNTKLFPSWLRFLFVLLLVLGVFFRFANLDRKVYWRDETTTSLRISGYTFAELVQQVYDGHKIGSENLQKYQGPNLEKGLADTLKSLSIEDSQHPPLYYAIARFWAQWFGHSVAVMRSLPALISLLTLPCMYWLCIELFDSPLVGWVSIALTSVSLIHVMYAQEARPYSLWIVTTLISSASLLRAMRLKTRLSWVIYAVNLALGFYSFLFTIFVAIGHGIYVFAIEKFQLSKTLINYLIASLIGIIAFLPWSLFLISNSTTVRETTNWLNVETSLIVLVKTWGYNISNIFFHGGFKSTWPVLIIVIYSIYFLCRQAPKRVWLFIVVLIAVPQIALILPDLILGGRRSTVDRYLFPSYLGIQLAVAYLFTTQITSISINMWRRKLWQIMMIALISAGVSTCVKFSQAEAWWYKDDPYNPPIARIINQAAYPLLISDQTSSSSIASLLSLSYLLESKVQIQLVVEPNIPEISSKLNSVFLYNPSETLRRRLEQKQNCNSVLVYNDERNPLWKLDKIKTSG